MAKKILGVAAAAAAVVLLSGCGPAANNQSNQAPNSSAPNNSAPAAQNSSQTNSQTASVAIQNFAFSPQTLTISKGTTVVWTNMDSVPHQIKSDTFNSEALSNGRTFSFTFSNAGTFNYSCAIHPSMMGKIVVQ